MKTTVKMTTALAAMLALLTACETMEGLGRDTQKLGGNVEKSAEKNDLDNDPNN